MMQLRFKGDELVVDNFAGGGGASMGIEAAIGRPIDLAINHDPEALAMHKGNHPATRHLCENLMDVDLIVATGGRPVGLAWFSPDCKHFSKAKGGRPVEKNIRGLAWVVLRWAAKVKPRVIILENVEEFKTWGPLRKGRPCKARKGETFQLWVDQLRSLGYQVEWKELKACDYGAPTIRKRLFLVARCDGEPIVWPEPTHGPGLIPYRTAAECIDWSIPCSSIFERKRPLVENTMRRIAKGIRRYVIEAEEPFIVRIDHQSSPNACDPVTEPLTTTTSKGRHCLVVPFVTPYYGPKSPRENRERSVNGPLPTQTTENRFGLVAAFLAKHFGGVVGTEVSNPAPTILSRGSQTQLVTAFISRQFGQSVGHGADEPLGTITGNGFGKSALVTSNLIKLRGSCKDGQPVDQPAPTITAGGNHIAEVRAFLIKYYGTAVGQSLSDPLHSTTSKARFGLVIIRGEVWQIIDIGMRMLSPRELFLAQGFPGSYIINPTFNGKPLTKTAQIKMCGNSVSPLPAEAVVKANFEERSAFRVRAG